MRGSTECPPTLARAISPRESGAEARGSVRPGAPSPLTPQHVGVHSGGSRTKNFHLKECESERTPDGEVP